MKKMYVVFILAIGVAGWVFFDSIKQTRAVDRLRNDAIEDRFSQCIQMGKNSEMCAGEELVLKALKTGCN